MSQLQPGVNLGPYQIVGQVGKGGMATVYKAFHPATSRYVAVKVLPEHLAGSPEFTNRFRREVETIANLQHPQILPVFDYGEDGGRMYMVMRFLDSGTLQERMQARRLTLTEIDRLFSQLLAALAYAHAQNVVHRDIKPSNALVDSQDNLFLTDFGIAKILEKQTKFTETGALVGTPDYMSPEQAQGQQLDGRSDIYSLGIILYEMVTGRVPFEAETPLAVILKHIHDPLPPPSTLQPGLSPAVEAVILKALAKKPEDRFATCGDFLRAWQAAAKAVPPAADRVTAAPPPAAAPQPRAATPPASGSGNRDLLIVLGVGGLAVTLVCLLAGAGLGGLSLLSSRLAQATSVPAASPGLPNATVEINPPPQATASLATPAARDTPSPPTELDAAPQLLPAVEAVNISNTQFESEYPQMVVDAQGHVHVIWGDKTDRKEGDVYYIHTTDTGEWATPEKISAGTGNLVGGSLRWLARPQGPWCALWYSRVWTLRCLQDGSWTAPQPLDVAPSWADAPAFVFRPDGSLAAAWYSFSDALFDGTAVSDGRNGIHDLRMALDLDGHPHMVWVEQSGSDFFLVSRYSPDGGQTWGDIEKLTEAETNVGLGSAWDLAADSQGNVHLAWASQDNSAYYRRWAADGGWGPVQLLPGGRPLLDLSLTTEASGLAHVASSGLVGSQRGIIYSEQTQAGWQPARLIAAEPGDPSALGRHAQVVVDLKGARHFVWQSAASPPDIFYAKLP